MARSASKGKKKATAAATLALNADGKYPKPTDCADRRKYRSLANVPGLTAAQRHELQVSMR